MAAEHRPGDRSAGGDRPERERLWCEVVAVARRLGDDALLATVLDARRHALWEPDGLDRQIATAREILRHAQGARAPELEIRARQWLIRDHLERGDVVAVEREMRRHAALARRLRVPRHLWHAAQWRALQAHLAGRLADADLLWHAALETGWRVDPVRARAHFAANLVVLRRDQGRLSELIGPGRPRNGRTRLPPPLRAASALLLSELELHDEARAELALLVAGGVGRVLEEPEHLVTLCVLAEASATLGERDAAGAIYEALRPHAARNVLSGDAPVFYGSVSRYVGLLASVLGRGAEAEVHLARALAMHVRLRARPLQARTRLDLGTALLRRDGEGDRVRAAVHLVEARALGGRLGMRLVERQAGARLASLALGAPSERPTASTGATAGAGRVAS